jgi:beta-lactamase regulating signal transducer with metallopeptidase domain
VHGETTVPVTRTSSSTPSYSGHGFSTGISKIKAELTTYIMMAIFMFLAFVGIFVIVFCGKRLLKKCRRDSIIRHNILQEEETSFSMTDLPMTGACSSSDDPGGEVFNRGVKQE